MVAERNGKIYLSNPKFEKVKDLKIEQIGTLFTSEQEEKDKVMTGIYFENKNLKSYQLRKIVEKCILSLEFRKIENLVPENILKKLHLPNRQNAIIKRHFPKNLDDVTVTNKFFAFEEIFIMQLYRNHEKMLRQDEHAYMRELFSFFNSHFP